MKGAEAAVKWKEMKGHARKLRGKGDERTGRGVRWPVVSRQRVNPATGRDRAAGQSPLGLTHAADHERTMRIRFWLGLPYEGRRIRGLV